jgi:hypothetical protein
MNLEKEGTSITKDHPNDIKVSPNNPSQIGEVGNPERDAAVDALLATFGSTKDENGVAPLSRKNSENGGVSVDPNHNSTVITEAQNTKHIKQEHKYEMCILPEMINVEDPDASRTTTLEMIMRITEKVILEQETRHCRQTRPSQRSSKANELR